MGLKAIEQNIARVKLSEEELHNEAKKIIYNAQNQTKTLMEKGFIPRFEDYIY
ncbi:MAG: hypothetical protein GF383_11205 [Candidatus Lokiarchaeota archaeon]|nr:hypothetical protein [Candidatus Lokiarchaeota archaeon]MBD3341275.1 hypothetical protein [Candidatus Lokiarchaeota archaeon]